MLSTLLLVSSCPSSVGVPPIALREYCPCCFEDNFGELLHGRQSGGGWLVCSFPEVMEKSLQNMLPCYYGLNGYSVCSLVSSLLLQR